MPTPGPLEIIILLVIVLLIFGPKRLPDLGRSLGRGMREFKDSVTGKDSDDEPPRIAKTESAPAEPTPTPTPTPTPSAEPTPTPPAEPTATSGERQTSD